MTERFVDFDAARAEREHEPLLLRAYGQTFELPGAMPASVFVDVVKMEEGHGGDGEITIKDAISLLRRLLPAAVLDGLLARPDFTSDDFLQLVGLVMRAYMGGEEPGEAEAVPPNRETRRHPAARKSARSRGSRDGSTSPQHNKETPIPGATS